jgi:hypothetical protein
LILLLYLYFQEAGFVTEFAGFPAFGAGSFLAETTLHRICAAVDLNISRAAFGGYFFCALQGGWRALTKRTSATEQWLMMIERRIRRQWNPRSLRCSVQSIGN